MKCELAIAIIRIILGFSTGWILSRGIIEMRKDLVVIGLVMFIVIVGYIYFG